MKILIKGAHLVDPQVNLDEILDLSICDGLINSVSKNISEKNEKFDYVVDAKGMLAIPGAIDLHVHFRDPGLEYKEDIESGLRAAAVGGFVGVCSMANTKPICDNSAVLASMILKYTKLCDKANSNNAQLPKLFPSCACTIGLEGKQITEMQDMFESGAFAFTDDGRGIQDSATMRTVLEYASTFGYSVLSHCQDEALSACGQINEGVVRAKLGLAGWPALAEELQIARDCELAKLTGAKLHIQHVSTARGVEIIKAAKKAGANISCEATPHHLFLCEEEVEKSNYNTNLKVNPPLRTKKDMLALQKAFCAGYIDTLSTDHAPHASHEKDMEFELAPFGTIGLETALSLIVDNLIFKDKLKLSRFVELCSINPAKVLGIEPATINEGMPANLTIIDLNHKWTACAKEFASKSKNSAFLNKEFISRPRYTIVDGAFALYDFKVCF
ncbi:MAG: dihydroorotase [Coriobacteriales bacterium]|nr:dihydroorotase [Coriobacteriales bacterium]